MQLIGVAVLIGVIYLIYGIILKKMDKKTLKPRNYSFTFIIGATICTLGIAIPEITFDRIFLWMKDGIGKELFCAFFRAALLEEGVKMLFSWMTVRKHPKINRTEAILLCGLIGGGYGLTEKLLYGGGVILIINAIVPFHIMFQFIMGRHLYDAKQAKLAGNMELSKKEYWKAFLIPFVLHGLWDSTLALLGVPMADGMPTWAQGLGTFGFILVTVLGIILEIRLIQKIRKDMLKEQEKMKEEETMAVNMEKKPELPKGVYTVRKMTDEITWIYDGINDSVYVVETEEAAFVIDTGMKDEPILPLIREKITEKPLILVVTHGHPDHVMRAAEFGPFHMSELDDKYIPEKAGICLKNRINVKDGDIISIPGCELLSVDSHGHTPGSFSFIDKVHKAVFTGDAFGSGNNVWLQLPGCSDLSEYAETVRRAIAVMKDYGVDDSYTFYGGHYEQQYGFNEDGAPNVLNLQLLEDMAVLCDKILAGEIVGTEEPNGFSRAEQAYVSRYGKAEMLYTLNQVK